MYIKLCQVILFIKYSHPQKFIFQTCLRIMTSSSYNPKANITFYYDKYQFAFPIILIFPCEYYYPIVTNAKAKKRRIQEILYSIRTSIRLMIRGSSIEVGGNQGTPARTRWCLFERCCCFCPPIETISLQRPLHWSAHQLRENLPHVRKGFFDISPWSRGIS